MAAPWGLGTTWDPTGTGTAGSVWLPLAKGTGQASRGKLGAAPSHQVPLWGRGRADVKSGKRIRSLVTRPEWNSPVTASHVRSDGTGLRSGWDISPWVGVWINRVHGPTQGRSSGGAKGEGLSWKHIPRAGTQPWPPAAMPGSSFARGKEAACSRTVAKLVPSSSNGPPGEGMLLGSLYTVEGWRRSCHLKSFSLSFLVLSQISCYLSHV